MVPLTLTELMRAESPSISRRPVPLAAVAKFVEEVRQDMVVAVCVVVERATSAASFFLPATSALTWRRNALGFGRATRLKPWAFARLKSRSGNMY